MKKIMVLFFIVFLMLSSTVFCQSIKLHNQYYRPSLAGPKYVDLQESNTDGYYKYINEIKDIGLSNVKFESHGTNWFVISWIKNGNIYYEKTFISNQYRNALAIFYPAEEKADFDVMLSTIEASFVPGWLTGYKIWG